MGNRVLRDRTIPNVYGVGYMGNNFELKSSCNGKKCPIYDTWFRMMERCYSKKLSLGYFENEMDAHLAYKTAKEEYLKELAEEYKDMLDPKAYIALQKYVVDIDD